MKVSREQMAANRERVLNEAARLFRERGFDAVTVSDVMKAAGLTHGAFYGHFKSKDDLIAQTITHTMAPPSESASESKTGGDLAAWLDAYLSPRHRDHAADGCPTAGLAGFLCQQTPEARAAMAGGLKSQIERLAALMPGTDESARRQAAIGGWSAMVGAVIMARAVEDPAFSDDILKETRAWLRSATASDERSAS